MIEHEGDRLLHEPGGQLGRVLAVPLGPELGCAARRASTAEACVCDLIAPLARSQATVSHHLALLVDAGLLTREKRGKWAWYRLVPERLEQMRRALG